MQLVSSKYSLAILPSLLLCTSLSFGQKRVVDHEAICISPEGEVINGKNLSLEFGMKVHGPDPRYANDTVVYRLSFIEPGGSMQVIAQEVITNIGSELVPIGTVVKYTEGDDITFTGADLKEPYTINFCVDISTFLINNVLDTFQYVSYHDPNPENDRCCKLVTILPDPASTAIAYRQQEEGIWVYPNPVRDRLHIFTSAGFAEKGMQVAIYDIRGRLLKDQQYVKGTAGEDTWSVDVGDMAAGIYHVHMQSSKGVVSRKIVVDR